MSGKEQTGRRHRHFGTSQRVGPWEVWMYWPADPDQAGPVSMEIKPAKDAADNDLIGGLSSTLLRKIDFRKARNSWVAWNKAGPMPKGPDGILSRAERLQLILGRDGVGEGYLAHLAEAYVFLVQNGERSVTAKLAEMTGRSIDTVKQHLHRVRKAQFLTTIPGKAGGQLTEEARGAMARVERAVTDSDREAMSEHRAWMERLVSAHEEMGNLDLEGGSARRPS